MGRFRLGDVWVRVHPSVWLVLAVVAAFGEAGRALRLLGAVLLHELAHLLSARRSGLSAYEVEILPFGGVARIDESALADPAVEARVVLAGPAASLLAGGLLLAAGSVWKHAGTGVGGPWAALLVQQVVEPWGWEHVGLGLFNLLPAFPLDGGRLLRAALARSLGYRAATRLAGQMGALAGAAMLIAGAARWADGSSGAAAALMGLFLLYAARRERLQSAGTWVRYLVRRAHTRPLPRVEEGRAIVVGGEATLKEVAFRFVPGRSHLVFLRDPDGNVVGLTGEAEVVRSLVDRGPHTPAARLAWRRL